MRQIDADALVRELTSIKVTFGSGNGLVEGGLSIAISATNGMPTVEPQRKKGRWILTDFPDEQTYKCSECGEYWIFIEGTPADNGAKYCPNCGAEMTGGDE